jgi:hypothetical protein
MRVTTANGTSGRKEPALDHSLDMDEAEQRSRIAVSLKQTIFPADKRALLKDARDNFAEAWVLSQLERLPDGESFENVQRAWEALGGSEEHRVWRPR